MADEQYIVQNAKVHVKLIKNTRGYNWEISVRDDYEAVVMKKVEEIDKEMRRKYGDE